MNLASTFVVAAIVALLVLAVRYLVRNGPCVACSEGQNCGEKLLRLFSFRSLPPEISKRRHRLPTACASFMQVYDNINRNQVYLALRRGSILCFAHHSEWLPVPAPPY